MLLILCIQDCWKKCVAHLVSTMREQQLQDEEEPLAAAQMVVEEAEPSAPYERFA
jgi:hypothetical protein